MIELKELKLKVAQSKKIGGASRKRDTRKEIRQSSTAIIYRLIGQASNGRIPEPAMWTSATYPSTPFSVCYVSLAKSSFQQYAVEASIQKGLEQGEGWDQLDSDHAVQDDR